MKEILISGVTIATLALIITSAFCTMEDGSLEYSESTLTVTLIAETLGVFEEY